MKNPTYRNIMDATEAFLVEFDPLVISYERILDEVRNIYGLFQFSIPVLCTDFLSLYSCDT